MELRVPTQIQPMVLPRVVIKPRQLVINFDLVKDVVERVKISSF